MKKLKKLALGRETLRSLEVLAAGQVGGAYGPTDFCNPGSPLYTLGCTGNPNTGTMANSCRICQEN